MPKVLTGSDVFASSSFSRIAGMTLGFVGNHTSRLSNDTPTHLAIRQSGKALLAKLFSPEHGAFGAEDHENVSDSVDPATSLPIYSLYGDTRKPTAEMLNGLDALVFELQDVGARFYTYASTMLLCLEAAAEKGIPLIVLDRPNPLGGAPPWDGPLPDPDKLSFVASSEVPVRHGLTLGEIAAVARKKRMLSEESLQVIRCANYTREQWWDETGLNWVSPSPAMNSLQTASVYPGVCLLEQADVSVGRGTEAPFLLSGAPWIDSLKWADAINRHAGRGVVAAHCDFTPSASKFAEERCHGVHLTITDRDALSSVRLGIAMIISLSDLHPERFELDSVNTLLASDGTLALVRSGASVDDVCRSWQAELEAWRDKTADCLLYP